jgi:hypothetical protein
MSDFLVLRYPIPGAPRNARELSIKFNEGTALLRHDAGRNPQDQFLPDKDFQACLDSYK